MDSLTFLILISLLKAILIADFVSGLGHWLEDRYGKDDGSWLGENIAKPNLEHHKTPRSFLKRSYWHRNNVMIIACIFIGILLAINGLHPFTNVFTMLLLSHINEVHAYAHRPISQTPKWVKYLQKVGLMQSKKHHNLHHASPYEVRYCILTNWLNPFLDKIQFFRFLEYLVLKIFKASPNL